MEDSVRAVRTHGWSGSDDEILVFTVLKAFWSNPQTRSVVLKVRSLDQQHQHQLRSLSEMHILGPSSGILNH